jgi:hypothetical protein
MDTERLLTLARQLVAEVKFCVAATQDEDGSVNARVVQRVPWVRIGRSTSSPIGGAAGARCGAVREDHAPLPA